MKKSYAAAAVAAVIAVAASGAFFLAGGMKGLKSRGYIEYTPEEARLLAYERCSQCHNTEKVAKYCMRCGPPLIVIVHNMNTLTKLERRDRGITALVEMTGAEAKAIAQVWNATVGNWEDTWRKEDLIKLLEGDGPLIELVETPVEKRPIEKALKGQAAPGAYM